MIHDGVVRAPGGRADVDDWLLGIALDELGTETQRTGAREGLCGREEAILDKLGVIAEKHRLA